MKFASVVAFSLLTACAHAQNVNYTIQDTVPGCNVLDTFTIANYSHPPACASAGTCVNMTGKIVLITGASTGMGRASAERLAQAGATVVGTSRYPWLYPDVTTFQLWQLEYTSDDSVKQLVSRVGAAYGRIDFLYLNAGRQYVGEMANSDLRQVELTINSMVMGHLKVIQAALPLMPQTGYARILQTSSVESQIGAPGYLPYTISKWAMQAMQEVWLTEHLGGKSNIIYSSILPGTVNSSLPQKAVYGCPELYGSKAAQPWYNSYTSSMVLQPEQIGEAVYQIAIDPQPSLRYLAMNDQQYNTLIPVWCRRQRLPMEQWYDMSAPEEQSWFQGEWSQNTQLNCSAHCNGTEFCGAAPMGEQYIGTYTIGPYK